MLHNPHQVDNQAIFELVRDLNDFTIHGPAYPLQDRQLIRWLEEPFEELKRKGKTQSQRLLKKSITTTLERIDEHLKQQSKQQIEKESDEFKDYRGYTIEYVGEGGWILARRLNPEEEPAGYDPIHQMYIKGYDKIVLYHYQKGRYKYFITKRSDFVDFPLGPEPKPNTILFNLDDIEKGWGGDSTKGGSPFKNNGSLMHPKDVCVVIDNTITKSRRIRNHITTPENITFLIKSKGKNLPLPEKVLRNIGLAFTLEPIPDKRGCTTRFNDLKPTITLEMLTSAAVNSSLAYMHLAKYCLEHQTIEGSYKFLLEAMTHSKWARDGGKVNQGMLEFTVPIVAAHMLYDPQSQKNPYKVLEMASKNLKATSRKDVDLLIETKKRGNLFSNVQHKYKVKQRLKEKTVYDYYLAELEEEKKKGYSTGVVHNRQFVEGFKDVGLLLQTFQKSKKEKFCDRVSEAYETLLEKQEQPIGKGLAADLVSAMLYLAFSYSNGDTIVN